MRAAGTATPLAKPGPTRGDSSWSVYILRCRGGSLYTGISTDVQARVAAHNRGRGARYTRAHRPVKLVHVEIGLSRSAALRREAAIKALPRIEKVRLLPPKPRPAAAFDEMLVAPGRDSNAFSSKSP